MYKLLYKILMIKLVLILLFLFRNESEFLGTVGNYSSLFNLILGVISLLIWWTYGLIKKSPKELIQIYHFWMITVCWMCIVPLVFFDVKYSNELFFQGMFHDYSYIIFTILPFVFVSKSSNIYYNKIFSITGTIAILCGIIAIAISDKTFSAIARREFVFTIPYYLWWIVTAVYPFLFLNYFFKGKNKKGLVLIILHIVLSIIFLKRSGFLDAMLLITFAILFSDFKGKAKVSILILIIFMFFLLLIFGSYFDLLISRFVETGNNLEEWDRNQEIEEFFKEATTIQLMTGFGLNNYIKMQYIGEYNKGVNSLHIGFYNILYKGGILYLCFMFFLSLKIFSLFKYIKFDNEIKIGFIIGIIFLISHSYEQGWSYFPSIFFILMPIYRAIYLKNQHTLKLR